MVEAEQVLDRSEISCEVWIEGPEGEMLTSFPATRTYTRGPGFACQVVDDEAMVKSRSRAIRRRYLF